MRKDIGICMLTGAFYPEISGGGGVQARTLIHALNKQFSFYVITTCRDYKVSKEKFVDGIHIYRVMIKLGSVTSEIKALLSFLWIFIKIRKKVDILHLHGFSTKALIFIILGKIFKKKIIQKVTLVGDDDPLSIQKKKFGKIKLFLFSKSDAFINVSPALSQRFRQGFLANKKVLTIPNGVDAKRFFPLNDPKEKRMLRRKLGIPEKNMVVIFVGIFALHKRADLLIDAWKKIRDKQNDNVSIILIGSKNKTHFLIDPILIKQINRDVNELKMGDEIIFIEKTLEIEKYYQASDIFVLPSRREGLPNVLLEAMSCGLACIATRIAGITDYIIDDNKNGMLFKIDNTNELSSRLSNLLHNEELIREIGNKAREVIISRFSIEAVSKEYSQLYDELATVNKYNFSKL